MVNSIKPSPLGLCPSIKPQFRSGLLLELPSPCHELVRVTFWGSKASTLLNLQHVALCINCEAFGKHHYCFGTFAMERHMANAWALKASKSMCASENGSAPMLMMFAWWFYFHYILVSTSVGFTVFFLFFVWIAIIHLYYQLYPDNDIIKLTSC